VERGFSCPSPGMRYLLQDFRFAGRQPSRSPGFIAGSEPDRHPTPPGVSYEVEPTEPKSFNAAVLPFAAVVLLAS